MHASKAGSDKYMQQGRIISYQNNLDYDLKISLV